MGITGKASPSDHSWQDQIDHSGIWFSYTNRIFYQLEYVVKLNDYNLHRRCKKLTFVMKQINQNLIN